MWLLITFSCAVLVHECIHQKQLMPSESACISAATAAQERADAMGIERFLLICREAKP
jgi:hypothetical protein